MRKVICGAAMSLDGYIAGPNGEYDWIVMDPDIDFAATAARFDTYRLEVISLGHSRLFGDNRPRQGSICAVVRDRFAHGN
jgi:hypothetical protein